MKRLLSLILFLLFFVITTPVQAKFINVQNGTATVEANEIINDDLFITGDTVNIKGTINGDIYAAGAIVTFSGTTTGDLFVGGGSIQISGVVNDDLYATCGNITITKTKIGDTLMIGAGSVTIDENSSIGGSLLAGVGQINSSARIGRNVYAGGGSLTFDNAILGEARVASDAITFGSKTVISKDLSYYMTKGEPVISSGATVSGTINRVVKVSPAQIDSQGAKQHAFKLFSGLWIGFKVIGFLASVTLGLFLLWYIPKTVAGVANTARETIVKSIGIGVLIAISIIPALILLSVTGIGFKIAGMAVTILTLFTSLSDLVTGLVIGNTLTKQFRWKNLPTYTSFLLGYTILSILMLIPIAGMLVRLVSGFFGLGALIIYHHKVKQ